MTRHKLIEAATNVARATVAPQPADTNAAPPTLRQLAERLLGTALNHATQAEKKHWPTHPGQVRGRRLWGTPTLLNDRRVKAALDVRAARDGRLYTDHVQADASGLPAATGLRRLHRKPKGKAARRAEKAERRRQREAR